MSDSTVNLECTPSMVYVRTEDKGVVPISRDDIAALIRHTVFPLGGFPAIYMLEIYLRDGNHVESAPLSYDEMYRGWGSLNTFEFSGYESHTTVPEHAEYQFRKGHWKLTEDNEVLYQNAGEWVKMFRTYSIDWFEVRGLFDHMESICSDPK